MKDRIYRNAIPLEEAERLWQKACRQRGMAPLAPETVNVEDAIGRVTAEPLFALVSSPFYHSAAMDGYAVKFADTFRASDAQPLSLFLGDGAVPVDTGDPIPEGFDAVIMAEDANPVQRGGREAIEIIAPATPWQHVRAIGEDIVRTELVLPESHRIRPVDAGALLSAGHVTVSVRRKPRVAIIPTGSELVEPGEPLATGNIIEYNSRILGGLAAEWGGKPVRFGPVPDDPALLKQTLAKACELYDVVVINAGSSAGSEDFTASVVSSLGEVILHGVNIKPGKPVLLGWVSGKPVLGIPGYPVSAYITFRIFGRRVIHELQGLIPPPDKFVQARLSRQVASSLGQEEFLRVKLGRVGEHLIATPVSRGAGVLMSLVRADGFVRIPAASEGYGAGAGVAVDMLREPAEIDRTVVCIGSHDNSLDLLANMLKRRHPECSLSSAHVGSLGGLIALKRGEAHMAGTHLLDETTGCYNVPFLETYLPDRHIALINLVYREQGFMVQPGNPKKIMDFPDLVRSGVRFINRQAGSGTRLLTDKHLREAGIKGADISGYDREEFTHMGVASAVRTGTADAGMGILAAAHALGLDFVPVARERYDLAIPAEFLGLPSVAALLGIIRDDAEFRDAVLALGGYDVTDMGKVMHES